MHTAHRPSNDHKIENLLRWDLPTRCIFFRLISIHRKGPPISCFFDYKSWLLVARDNAFRCLFSFGFK